MYVVITGASRGIGYNLAKVFAKHKYNLILTCEKNIDKLNELKNELVANYNTKVINVVGNLYDENNKTYIENVKNDVYILINNQSKSMYKLIQDVNIEEYNEIIDSNVTNQVFTTKLFVDEMIKHKQGIIVNISSIWGQFGASNEIIYSMTKGAIDTFTKSLAKELELSNIDVIAFSLGMVNTDMNKHFTEDEIKDILLKLDNHKMLEPIDVSEKIYEIIAKRDFKTGSIININNGLK